MKKFFYSMMTVALMVGLSLSGIACSDSNKDENGSGGNNGDEPQIENEQEELGWRLISQLTDEGSAPAGWMDKTFEPTIGKAVEGEPYTRVVSTNDVDAAAARFAELAGNPAGFSEVMSGYSYSVEGMGKLTYKRGSETEPYLAQVDVDLKQVPHLKKILYQTPSQQGNNATVTGTAYYRFGDVVQDGEGSYWVCVRPSFGPEGKGDSHWISVSMPLPKKNIYEYHGNNNDYYLPTGLGESVEHMQNLCEMLYAMLYPSNWLHNISSSPKPKMFHDFSYSNYKYHNVYFWQRVERLWEDNNLYTKVFGCSMDAIKEAIDNNNSGLNFVYSGKSWPYGWEGGVYHAQFTNGSGNESNMHKLQKSTVKKNLKNMPIDFRQQVDPQLFDNDGRLRFVLRYKNGKQLSSNGRYDPKTAISGATDVYVYNKVYDVKLTNDPEVTPQENLYSKRGYYVTGDVVLDVNGTSWICLQESPNDKQTPDNNYAYFVSFEQKAIGTGPVLNLPSKKLAMQLLFGLSTVYSNYLSGDAYTSMDYKKIANMKQYAYVDMDEIFALRDTLHTFGAGNSEHENVQFVSTLYYDDGQLYVLRLVNDLTASQMSYERVWSWRFYDSYTRNLYSSPKKMLLSDLSKSSVISEYNQDRWVRLPWITFSPQRKLTPSSGYLTDVQNVENLSNYLYKSGRSWLKNQIPTNMYREPITIFAVKRVADIGVANNTFEDGTRFVPVNLMSQVDEDMFGKDYKTDAPLQIYREQANHMYLNDEAYRWDMNNKK